MGKQLELIKDKIRPTLGVRQREYRGFGYKVTITDTEPRRQILVAADNPLTHPKIIVGDDGKGFMDFMLMNDVGVEDVPDLLDGIEDARDFLESVKNIL